MKSAEYVAHTAIRAMLSGKPRFVLPTRSAM